jgi:hypothetical protein
MKKWWTVLKLVKRFVAAPTWVKIPLVVILLLVLLLVPVLGLLGLLVVVVLALVSFILARLGRAADGLVSRFK